MEQVVIFIISSSPAFVDNSIGHRQRIMIMMMRQVYIVIVGDSLLFNVSGDLKYLFDHRDKQEFLARGRIIIRLLLIFNNRFDDKTQKSPSRIRTSLYPCLIISFRKKKSFIV